MNQPISPKRSIATTTGRCTALAAALRWHAVRIVVVGGLTLVWLPWAPAASAATACCAVTNISSGQVTAQETRGARTFQFQVADPALLRGLRVGSPVYANFDTKQVSLDGKKPCCTILSVSTTERRPVPAQGNLAVPGIRKGKVSPPSENEDDQPDPPPLALIVQRIAPVNTAGAKHVTDLQNVQAFLQALGHEIANWHINTALIGGNKYMVADCLGIKASAGEFNFKPGAPSLRIDGTGVLLQFVVDRITMNALMVRIQPNVTNPAKPCHFSKRFGVGGSASDVRFEIRFDPLLDLKQCRVMTAGNIRMKFAIGGLNLKPLQNNLDPVAKNMIEDAINGFLENGSFGMQIMNGMVRALGTTCKSAGT